MMAERFAPGEDGLRPGVLLTNARSRAVIARDVEMAVTRTTRRKGLLSRASLEPGFALVLAPCWAIHTAFMRFGIDVIFVDRGGYIRRIVRRLPPWRIAASPGAYATIELAAGALDACDLAVGDRLCLGMSLSTGPADASTERSLQSASWGARMWGRLRADARSATGVALVELAIVTPLLVLMALGVGDFGRVLYTSIVLAHAARAGASYGAQSNATAADAAGIRLAAQREAQEIGNVTVASQRICECPNGSVISCTTATCAGYGPPQVFVQVTATMTFQTLVPYPVLPSSVALSRTARVRRQ